MGNEGKEHTDIDAVMRILSRDVEKYDVPVAELVKTQTDDPFKILVATILSARTNDKTTAMVCRKLFEKVKRQTDLAKLSVQDIEKLIYPVGFYKTKARMLRQLPDVLQKKFNGNIPHEIDDLMKLPGVGRKTANLVRAVAFQKSAICVDTHVHRITNRWGYVKTKTPFETEMALRAKLPKKYWLDINWTLVAFGQNICRPISPKCSTCPIREYCARVGVTQSR